ncbi:MAG: aminotransferase class III-fold pyridoxal phosphate-dependent enzyme [Candidatus Thorarchaeota archaeon]|nr:MAG: aminotransferase class III-fold pyridoxal phosphate-dependent enzyme [Candidatus Thorarchaeota archaeon]
MSTKDAFRPRFDKQEAAKVAEDIFSAVGDLRELPSERDRNYYVRTDSGEEFVLKFSALSDERDIIESQNSAMLHIVAKTGLMLCPTPTKSKEGRYIEIVDDPQGNHYMVRLLRYVPGKVYAKVNPHSTKLLREFGEFIGSVTKALQDFKHPAAHRDLYWDMKNADQVIPKHVGDIGDPVQQGIVKHFLSEYENRVKPALSTLRKSVVHNDFNDYNVIVDWAVPGNRSRFGVVDFGDLVFSHTVFELAIAIAYAVLGHADPIAAAAEVVKGYHSVFPLEEHEIDLLFYMICTRLTMTVAIAAYQSKLEPQNEYLRISEEMAWEALEKLRVVNPRLVTYTFRDACDLVPCQKSSEVTEWLKKNRKKIGSIVDFDLSSTPHVVFDLSAGSTEFGTLGDLMEIEKWSRMIEARLRDELAEYGVGRYDEARLIYAGDQYSLMGIDGPESRTVHLAIDLFLESGTPLFAPLDGTIHSFRNNDSPLDNGPTIVVEHSIENSDLKFYTLYAHLSLDSIDNLVKGSSIRKGDKIGEVGEYPTNGGWPSHLHFQVIVDMIGREGDFFGAASPNRRQLWKSISPDPNVILGLPDKPVRVERLGRDEILDIRSQRLSSSLSLMYEEPIEIVEGYMQYLYDKDGRAYLDARNNVPIVGHSHPKVVEALQRQAAVLNTNTRYIHEALVEYAEKLCTKFPMPLSICFFVNSGSEANELALRLARAYTGNEDMIVIEGAYHGNTEALVGLSPYKSEGPGGKGMPPHVHKVRIPDTFRGPYRRSDSEAGKKYATDLKEIVDELAASGRKPAAFLCESIMSCGGQIVFPEQYLKSAFRHVREAGGICIVDEVQVGFGRVGTHFWGFETQGVVPDIVTLGKPIGNGHPIGAVITTREIAESLGAGMEWFSTTGGNTVSCAVGLTVLDVLEEEALQENAHSTGSYLIEQLSQLGDRHSIIGDVRGSGLFIGVELVGDRDSLKPAAEEARYIAERMKDNQIMIGSDGIHHNVLIIKPSLVFSKIDADRIVKTLDKILAEDFVSSAG